MPNLDKNYIALIEGEIQTISLIFPLPRSESLNILVNFDYLKGMWVRDCIVKAEMQWPSLERLPFMLLSSCSLIYLSWGETS